MRYMIIFMSGFALGLGIALWVHLKNKWARDELVKTKALAVAQEKMNDILKTKLPKTARGRVDMLNELERSNKRT